MGCNYSFFGDCILYSTKLDRQFDRLQLEAE